MPSRPSITAGTPRDERGSTFTVTFWQCASALPSDREHNRLTTFAAAATETVRPDHRSSTSDNGYSVHSNSEIPLVPPLAAGLCHFPHSTEISLMSFLPPPANLLEKKFRLLLCTSCLNRLPLILSRLEAPRATGPFATLRKLAPAPPPPALTTQPSPAVIVPGGDGVHLAAPLRAGNRCPACTGEPSDLVRTADDSWQGFLSASLTATTPCKRST